jgi:putative flippase GtrA
MSVTLAAAWRRLAVPRLLGRHQLAAASGTSADFAAMIGLVELAGLAPPTATLLSALVGGAVNFVLSRGWVFRSSHRGTLAAQALRYGLACGGGSLLNAMSLRLALSVTDGVPYVVPRMAMSLLVSVAYSYPMHRWFVFRAGPVTSMIAAER